MGSISVSCSQVLKLSLNKVKRIEDPESFLCRSVLINNTIKRLQREVREEKMMRHGGSGGYFSKLSMHSSFRKSFTSSPPRLSDLHRLCAPPEDLMDDDDGSLSLLSPVSPPPTIIIPNLPCISTTTTSFTSSTPSSTTCNQLVDPLSHLSNSNEGGRNSSASDNDSSEFCNGNGVSSTNSRKRVLSDDEDDSCDVLSQIYIPPTPCIISAIDDDSSKDRLDACDSTSLSSAAAPNSNTESYSAPKEATSLGDAGNSKKPRLSLLSDDDEDHCVSSTSHSHGHGVTFNGNVVIDSSCTDTSHNSALTDSNASTVASLSYAACTSSTYAPAPTEVTSSSCRATMSDDDDVDIDIDVVGDCETSDWPTLPIHYGSAISSKSTTTIITTAPATLVTNTTTMTTNSCLTHHLPLIHQYSLDDELDLSTSSPMSADVSDSISPSTLEGNGNGNESDGDSLECKSSSSNAIAIANREITSSFDDEDEMSLLDNTKENTCTLPQLLSCSSSLSSSIAASYSTTSTGVNNNNTCSSSSPFYCSPAAASPATLQTLSSMSPLDPQSLHNKCAANSFMSVCNSFNSNNNSNCGSINCNNNSSSNSSMEENSPDKQQHQPPPSPSQYSSCGHSTIFSELQSTVFHSLITSLET